MFSKISLKNKLEEQVRNLDEYSTNDVVEHPGWAFLLGPVIKAYGICPFLNIHDEQCRIRRVTWLMDQPDKGKLYYDTLKEYIDGEDSQHMDQTLENLRTELINYVKNVLDELALPDNVTHDLLIENIKMRKEAKSHSQHVKETWKQTIRCLEYISTKKGIDFGKYVRISYGYVIQFKAPEITNPEDLDKTYVDMYEKYSALTNKVKNSRSIREKEKIEAEIYLSNLIKQDFKLNQVGRYFKKWASLSDVKKEERIKSYCDWYMRENNKYISCADDMKKWILEKLDKKELRIMDVKWDSKLGIITHVNMQMSEDGTFELGKRAPRILKTRRTSKKKKEDWFKTPEEKKMLERANRLLLYEIVKGQSLCKENVVKSVQTSLHTRLVPSSQLMDYLTRTYDEVFKLIKENPI